MFNLKALELPTSASRLLSDFGGMINFTSEWQRLGSGSQIIMWLAAGALVVVLLPNSMQLKDKIKASPVSALAIVVILYYSISQMTKVSEFLYFQF